MDTHIQSLIAWEYNRQKQELEMIASENYVSKQVMEAYANVFTNKYSEWYPGKRYYGGQMWVDKLELLCQWRALKMFGLVEGDESDTTDVQWFSDLKASLKSAEWSCNVQPLSGSPANLAVYLWCLKPWDTILWMDLWAWWHLTHGHPLNASGVFYNIVAYGVTQDEHLIDYNEVMEKALEHQPAMILAGFSAYSRKIEWSEFTKICDAVEATHGYRPLLMVDMAHVAGLIAWGVYPDPFPHVDIVTTTTHKTLRWPRGGLVFMRKGKVKRNNEEISLTKLINRWVFPGMQWWPHEHVIAAKAVAFKEVIDADFASYAAAVVKNAQALSQALVDMWWSIVSGWTDNHLLMVDITQKGWISTWADGKIAEHVLEEVGISCNKNMIPFDTRSPMNPSGIRLGTPAITTRGLGVEEIKIIASVIDQAIVHHDNADKVIELKKIIHSLCEKFPLWYD